jgi:hypothetical protein
MTENKILSKNASHTVFRVQKLTKTYQMGEVQAHALASDLFRVPVTISSKPFLWPRW